MSILVTGDTHGDYTMNKLNNKNVLAANAGEYPSHIIIAGDFGLIWSNDPQDRNELYWAKWLNSKTWETVVVLGNHENYERIYQLPMVERFGAPVYQYSPQIHILQHGNVYRIAGKTFFIFGGGDSIDKSSRKNRIEWWAEEIPTKADCDRAMASLSRVRGNVDYVITHTAPSEVAKVLTGAGTAEPRKFYIDPDKYHDPTVAMLDAFSEQVTCDAWMFGHFHLDHNLVGTETWRRYHALYNSFYRIPSGYCVG